MSSFRDQLEFALAVTGVTGSTSELRKFHDEAERGADKSAEKFEAMGGRLQKVGAGLTLGLTVPLVGAFMSSIGPASDLNEQVSKTEQLFGESSKTIVEWASNAAQSMGQSERAALEGAGTFGTLFLNIGKSKDEAGQMSQRMVELAGDLASFNNTSPEQAIEAIGAALRGEAEPIRQYGVLLDDATLRQKALEMGLISSVKEGLDPAQKAAAAYQVILDKTGQAQGDFARTSDGLANKQRIASAELENAKAKLGESFLPVATQAIGVVADLAHGFSELPEPMRKLAVYGGIAAAAIGPLTTGVGTAVKSLETLRAVSLTTGPAVALALGPFGMTVAAAGAAAVAIGLLGDEEDEATGEVKEMTRSLTEQSEALGRVSRDSVAQQIAAGHLEEAFANTGLSIDQFMEGARGWSKDPALNEMAVSLVKLARSGQLTGPELEGLQKIASALDHTYVDLAEKTRVAASSQDLLAESSVQATVATEDVATAQAAMASAMGEAQQSIDAAAEATANFKNELDDLNASTLDVEDAQIHLRQSADEIAEGYREAREDGKITRQEQDKLTLSTNDAVRAAGELVEKMVESGAVADTAAARQAALKFALGQVAAQAPDTQGKVDDYLRSLNEIPTEVKTTLQVENEEALRRIREVAQAAAELQALDLGSLYGPSIPRG